MTTRRSVFMTAVVVLSVLVSGVAFSGSAMALEADTAAPYPHSPGTTADEFPISVVAESGDAITRNGMKSITLDFSADSTFDGSVRNVSEETVNVAVIGQTSQRTVGAFNVSTSGGGQVTITFRQPVPIQAGDRIVVDAGGVTTPSADGEYVVAVSATAPSGATDGPVPVNYRVASAELDFQNQSASQFSENQTITVSGVIPNAGYIGVFTVAENGSRRRLVGSTEPIIARYDPRTYTVNLNGNVEESQQLVAVAYYETSGSNQVERLNGTFDPQEDNVVANNGVPANATAFITTLPADARITAGNQYAQGIQLYFSQGQPNTAYQVQRLQNGEPGRTVAQFETAANGTAVIDTAGFSEGQYVVTRIADGSVVGLDDDSTTSAQDDSFFITSQTFTETTPSSNTTGTVTGGNTTAAGTGSANNTGGSGASGNGSSNGGGADGGNGGTGDSGSGGSGAFGPGFGVVVAVVALLGAALLATRRE